MPATSTSPGHQAGAPLRRCQASANADSSSPFPRPSGRGSIAAAPEPVRASWLRHVFPRPSGRGSIAARRAPQLAGPVRYLPPAIRPGLHCGVPPAGFGREMAMRFPRPSGRGSIAARSTSTTALPRSPSSPGHQAGAPLRRETWPWSKTGSAPSSSPGHQAGAPLRRPGRPFRPREALLPPAIRPGLHCGDPAAPWRWWVGSPSPGHQAGAPLRPWVCCSSLLSVPSSPGHQAGAPLRPLIDSFDDTHESDLPPAIRPGLHCGNDRRQCRRHAGRDFPRPSGRGSIAASGTEPHGRAGRSFPRPSGRGSIAAAVLSTEHGPSTSSFPRPSGRGSIAAQSSTVDAHVAACLPPAIRPGLHCGFSTVTT